MSGYWFSKNPDRAWAEKLYLIFIPIFFAYNAIIQQMGWLDAGNFWHVTQNLLMWVPYCVLLPWILRRILRRRSRWVTTIRLTRRSFSDGRRTIR